MTGHGYTWSADNYRVNDERFFFRKNGLVRWELYDSWDERVCPNVIMSRRTYDKLVDVYLSLENIIEVGKRDLSNPKYDSYFREAKKVLDNLNGLPAAESQEAESQVVEPLADCKVDVVKTPTLAGSLYSQMVGRGLRPSSGIPVKPLTPDEMKGSNDAP